MPKLPIPYHEPTPALASAANPPCFPVGRGADTKGISARDFFAALAPVDVPPWFEPFRGRRRSTHAQLRRLARWRYALAEEMLVCRLAPVTR